MDLTSDEKALLRTLRSLHVKLRDHTFTTYHRINPFYEDLFEWKERGRFWTRQEGVTIYNSASIVGDVHIGANTWIGPFCSLDGTAGLRIGSYCALSVGTQVLTHDTVRWCLSGGVSPYEYAPVAIGNRCFIGSHAVILKGVIIGDGCVIGAGAVVTADVPNNTIVAGVPAQQIGRTQIEPDGSIELIMYASALNSTPSTPNR
jgi:acetyltransferase-like isoleucine patch superfamily enzyme